MNLIFDKKGNLVLSQKNVNKFYIDNEDYIIAEVEDYDIEYSYSYNDGVVKGDKIELSEDDLKAFEEVNKKLEYQQPRKKEYPAIEEQLDKLFHDIENGTLNKNGNFYKAISGVKDKYPKA